MLIRVRAFAIYRELLGKESLELDLPAGATPRVVFAKLFQEREDLARMLRATMFAVNREYVDVDAPLSAGDELSLIPPVAGGLEVST